MKKITLSVVTFATLTLQAHDDWCLNHHISVYADYGYIHRGKINNRCLVESFTLPANVIIPQDIDDLASTTCLLSAKKLTKELQWESAIRGGIIYTSSPYAALELVYTYFYPWQARQNVKGNDDLRFPFLNVNFGLDYEKARRVVATYESFLQNGELNYWGYTSPPRVDYCSFSWNMGFRVMELNEKLKLAFSKENGDTSFYRIKTFNVLYGAQLGARLQVYPSPCWTWTFYAKGVAFFNTAENKVNITDENNTFTLRKYKKERWTDSYLIEAYGELAYNLNSFLSFHYGYQGFILTGVVLAPEQRDIKRSTRRRINTDGTIYINGMYGGLSFGF